MTLIAANKTKIKINGLTTGTLTSTAAFVKAFQKLLFYSSSIKLYALRIKVSRIRFEDEIQTDEIRSRIVKRKM